MASLKFDYSGGEFSKSMNTLASLFPEIRSRFLGYIGTSGRNILKLQYLSGQELNIENDTDEKGRPLVNYSFFGRGDKMGVKISSYPVNLFERGRKLRSGKKEPGKKIITVKLKQNMSSQLSSIANRASRSIIENEMKRLGL